MDMKPEVSNVGLVYSLVCSWWGGMASKQNLKPCDQKNSSLEATQFKFLQA